MNATMLLILIKALIAIAPMLITAIVAGKIKSATTAEIITALSADWQVRIDAANAAKPVEEVDDPLNRSR